MIFIKSLKWSNWFSYGLDNFIDFDDSTLIQIMGLNGAGKTSIPLIIEEVLYGKNSKGIKKQSLPNRYLDDVTLYAELVFNKDFDKYIVTLTRKSTLKLKLEKNGIDISAHTSTNTYKIIQDILGMDFKTFTQLIYQSSKSNLEFLTATDTNRKKFLISLFNLDKYIKIHEIFKKVYTDLTLEISTVTGKLTTLESWIKKHEKMDFTIKPTIEIPKVDSELIDKLGELKSKVNNIIKTNIDINKNNQYKELLATLDTTVLSSTINTDTISTKPILISNKNKLNNDKISNNTLISSSKATILKYSTLGNVCHTCSQEIPDTLKENIIRVENDNINHFSIINDKIDKDIELINKELADIYIVEEDIRYKDKVSAEFVRLSNLIDKGLQTETLNEKSLKDEINTITDRINSLNKDINTISLANEKISSHNSRVEVVKEQLKDYKSQICILELECNKYNDTLNKVNIIKKAFGTTGLLNYKVEYLTKDLENQINVYLSELSSGRFQLLFVLDGEKLNIKIVDNGKHIDIEELSAGELARINASTLLAIRKLMSAISSTKINLLFLDEILGVLDADGKEKLIEVLSKEKELNTLLVSHEFSHALIPKILIVRENEISRIEDDR